MKEELNLLNNLLKKKTITYSEFNDIIGNYFVLDYDELEDNYYLLKIMSQINHDDGKNYYTDYVQIVK